MRPWPSVVFLLGAVLLGVAIIAGPTALIIVAAVAAGFCFGVAAITA